MQQLHEKKAIEYLHSQLVATGGLVQTLEQHHVMQADEIEANLKRAMEVYEQARKMRQQQNILVNLIRVLRRDLGALRAAAGLPSPPGASAPEEEERTTKDARPLGELPSLTDRLHIAASASLADVAGYAGARTSFTSQHALTGPAAFAASAAAAVAAPASAEGAAGRASANAPDHLTETALEALAMLSSVAVAPAPASGASHQPPPTLPRFPAVQLPAAAVSAAMHACAPTYSAVDKHNAARRAMPPPAANDVAHTTLTEHSLTAHSTELAAAGLDGPSAMGMWIHHVSLWNGLPNLSTSHGPPNLSTSAAIIAAPSRPWDDSHVAGIDANGHAQQVSGSRAGSGPGRSLPPPAPACAPVDAAAGARAGRRHSTESAVAGHGKRSRSVERSEVSAPKSSSKAPRQAGNGHSGHSSDSSQPEGGGERSDGGTSKSESSTVAAPSSLAANAPPQHAAAAKFTAAAAVRKSTAPA